MSVEVDVKRDGACAGRREPADQLGVPFPRPGHFLAAELADTLLIDSDDYDFGEPLIFSRLAVVVPEVAQSPIPAGERS